MACEMFENIFNMGVGLLTCGSPAWYVVRKKGGRFCERWEILDLNNYATVKSVRGPKI